MMCFQKSLGKKNTSLVFPGSMNTLAKPPIGSAVGWMSDDEWCYVGLPIDSFVRCRFCNNIRPPSRLIGNQANFRMNELLVLVLQILSLMSGG